MNKKQNAKHFYLIVIYSIVSFIIIGVSISFNKNKTFSSPQSASAADLQPVSYWKTQFDSTSMDLNSGDGLRCNNRSLNPSSEENLYHFGSCIDGLTSIYLATKDTKYIDRAFLYLNNIISKAQTNSNGYKVWNSNSESLDASHGWRAVARFLYVIRTNDALYNNTNFRNKFNDVLAYTEKHVFENYYQSSQSRETKQPSGEIQSSLIYRGRTHMASHWPYMAMYLRKISTNNTSMARYDEVIRKYDNDLSPYAQSSLRKQLIPNKNVPTAVFFSDRWGRFDGIGSDMHHAQDTIGYIIDAYELGSSEWKEVDIFKLRETFKKVIWKGTKDGEWQKFAGFMDGSNGNPDTIIDGVSVNTEILGRCLEDGFIKLGRYDSQAQEILQGHSTRGCMPIAAYGNLALNVSMLNSRGSDLRTFNLDEVKASYDTITTIKSIQAESYNDAKGVEVKGTYISSFDTGDWIKYDNVNLTNAKQIKWLVNGRNSQNFFQVRIDSPTGQVISYLHTQAQDDTSSTSIRMRELVSTINANISGTKTIYLTAGPYYGVANIDSFEIQSRSPGNLPAPKPSITSQPTPSSTPIITAKPSTQSPSSSPNSAAKDRVVIRARGDAAKNSQGVTEYPIMRININGSFLNQFTVTNAYQDYIIESNKVLSAQVHYINDTETDSSADRNLQVDYISINGNIYQSESPYTYSVGTWLGSDCKGGYKQKEWLHCDGYFEYDISSAGEIGSPTLLSETIEAEAFTKTGGKVVVAGQETKPGVLSRDGYVYRFDPGDFITYTLKNPIKSYNQITLYLKSRNTGGTIEILSGIETGAVIGSQTGFRPSGLTLPSWQVHPIQLQSTSYQGNNVTLRNKDMYEIGYIDRLVFQKLE